MKKVLFIFALLLPGLTAGAQEWEKTVQEADDMRGTPAMIVYEWKDEDFSFTFGSMTNEWTVKIGVGDGFKFDPTHLNRNNNFVCYGDIGFYDRDGQLVDHWKGCTFELTNFYRHATSPFSRKTKGQYSVTNYLKYNDGYVRLIIPTQRGELDARIPCLSSTDTE